MRDFLLCVAILILLVSCATEQKYRNKVNSWVGSSREQLINKWGEPNSISKLEDGSSLYNYMDHKYREVPTRLQEVRTVPEETLYAQVPVAEHTKIGIPFGVFPEHQTNIDANPAPIQNLNFFCNTIFEINSVGVISRASFYGNNCLSR